MLSHATFRNRPSLYGCAEGLAAALGGAIGASVIAAVTANDRGCRAIDRAVTGRIAPLPERMTPGQSRAAMMSGRRLALLAVEAGAVWHARAIAGLVDAHLVRALTDWLGPEIRITALRCLSLAPPDRAPQDAAAPSDAPGDPPFGAVRLEDLPNRVLASGRACLLAWSARQPAGFDARFRLRIGADAALSEVEREFGPPIIETLLAREEGA